MSATTFKRVLFWFGTAAFTISLNGALALAESSDMSQKAISEQKSSLKLQSLTMQSGLQSFSSTPSNALEAKTTSSAISTSTEVLNPNFHQVDFIAQQPSTPIPSVPAGARPSQTAPRPAPPNGGATSDPIDTPSEEGQFNSPTQTPNNSETGGDEVDNSTPGTSAPDTTPDTEVDEFGNPVPDTTAPDDTFDSDTDTPDTDSTDSDFTPGAGISPGRATRSGPSYIGVGGNIGIGSGDTAVGEGAFAIISKIGLTNYLSVRPSVLFSDSPTFLIPVTFDFIPGITDVTEDLSGELGLRISPFIGGGVALSTGDDVDASFLITGGVDVPIRERVSANASVNFTLGDETAIGLILGVGYNF